MTRCPWEEIDAFRSPGEFERFECWMSEQLQAKSAVAEPVTATYFGVTTRKERWYRHVASGELWRLVNPDPPFYGVFLRVED